MKNIKITPEEIAAKCHNYCTVNKSMSVVSQDKV